MKKLLYIMLIAKLVLFGCQSNEHEADVEPEAPTVVVTQWTDKMEIFMEYETPVTGHEIKFIIHLTTLADFQAIRAGKVILSFKSIDGVMKTIEKDQLLREGIFTPVATFDNAGEYDFKIQYEGPKASETFTIGKFTVYSSIADIPAEKAEIAVEEITFLKEQQWKIDFVTEEARVRSIKSAVQAVGEVKPRPASYAEIVSPVEGIISIAAANQLVNPGQKVNKGQILAVLVPPLAAQNSWAEVYLNYEQAEVEYKRSKRLKERSAISDREFEQTRRNYQIHKAGFTNYFGKDGNSSVLHFDPDNQQFSLTAPINGIVNNVLVLPGQKVNRHQKLFSIVDPAVVWLKFELFASQIANLSDISSLSISIPGKNEKVNLSKSELTLISRGKVIDPQKRTVTLWLEVNNLRQQFMIGQTFNAQLYTGEDTSLMTVPVSAVYDDNTQKVVFVHTGGESFEKREVTTGPVYHNYVAILDGIESGERVVTSGGYQVKMASNSEEVGHGHTH